MEEDVLVNFKIVYRFILLQYSNINLLLKGGGATRRYNTKARDQKLRSVVFY